MLRSSNELLRYHIEASDGTIGAVKDFYFDDETWAVRYIVVDTGSFLSSHSVLLDPGKIVDPKYPEESIILSLTKAELEASPGIETDPPVSVQREAASVIVGTKNGDAHLRSANAVCGYQIAATDQALGPVHEFMIDVTNWTIRYLVVDTGEWLTGKLVLLPPSAISKIDWNSQTVTVNVSSENVRSCPEYDGKGELTRDYEAFLHDHYGWSPYWK